MHEGLPVVEIVNNWTCASFEETYRPPLIGERIAHVLRAVQPDVVHVHNLLNLSFDLPALAATHGAPVVATCTTTRSCARRAASASIDAEQHVCHTIDTARCARCFRESPFYAQISFGRLAAVAGGSGLLGRAATASSGMARRLPALAGGLSRAAARVPHIGDRRRRTSRIA